jgi:hypothetical protein
MEFKVGSIEEIDFIANLIQKQSKETNDNEILDYKEYKYLKYLIFKYCLIPNPCL